MLEIVKTCFWAHNAHNLETQYQRSLCALEMKSFMYAAINSASCMKRSDFKLNFNPTQFCDPLGDRNIHWPLAPLDESDNTVIMVTARLDASSLFDGVTPGAGNAVTGFVTLLATAYYLNYLNVTVDSEYQSWRIVNETKSRYMYSRILIRSSYPVIFRNERGVFFAERRGVRLHRIQSCGVRVKAEQFQRSRRNEPETRRRQERDRVRPVGQRRDISSHERQRRHDRSSFAAGVKCFYGI